MTRTHVNSRGQTVTWCIGCQKIIPYESWPQHASHHPSQRGQPFTPEEETAALARRAYGKAIIDHTTTIDHRARPSRTSETRARREAVKGSQGSPSGGCLDPHPQSGHPYISKCHCAVCAREYMRRAEQKIVRDGVGEIARHAETGARGTTMPSRQTGRNTRRAEKERSRRKLLTTGAAAEIALLIVGLILGWMLTVVAAASWAALFLAGALWHQFRLARENRRADWVKVARMELDIYGRIFHDPITGKPNYL